MPDPEAHQPAPNCRSATLDEDAGIGHYAPMGGSARAGRWTASLAALALVCLTAACESAHTAPRGEASTVSERATPFGSYTVDGSGCLRPANATFTVCPLADGSSFQGGAAEVAVAARNEQDIIIAASKSAALEIRGGPATMYGKSLAIVPLFNGADQVVVLVSEQRGQFTCRFREQLFPALVFLACAPAT